MIDMNTPLWKLTVGEFIDLQKKAEEPVAPVDYTCDKYVYGRAGIAKLLGVSVTTVSMYRQQGWIEPAISQRGKKIICDAKMARELFEGRQNAKQSKTEEA
jgi:hypothetical protein